MIFWTLLELASTYDTGTGVIDPWGPSGPAHTELEVSNGKSASGLDLTRAWEELQNSLHAPNVMSDDFSAPQRALVEVEQTTAPTPAPSSAGGGNVADGYALGLGIQIADQSQLTTLNGSCKMQPAQSAMVSASTYDSLPPENAFNDNTNMWDFWQSANNLPQFIQFDFYTAKSFCAWSITSRVGLYATCDSPLQFGLWASSDNWQNGSPDNPASLNRKWYLLQNTTLKPDDWNTDGNQTFMWNLTLSLPDPVYGMRLWINATRSRTYCCQLQNLPSTVCNGNIVSIAEVGFFEGLAGFPDCIVSNWTYSNCSTTCGPGSLVMTREILQYPQGNGLPCPSLVMSGDCDPGPCEVDCIVSEWITQGCDVTCGKGSTTRTRTVTTPASGGGKPCPALRETTPCTLQPCLEPVDCALGEWQKGPCSVTCGDGTVTLTRPITQQPENGGKACPDASTLTKTQTCNLAPCPIDCTLGQEERSLCSVTCGLGTRTVTRKEQSPAQFGGKPCIPTEKVEACQEADCPIDCKLGDPVEGPCSVTCGDGIKQINTPITQQPANGGKACPDPSQLKKTTGCSLPPCPVDCKVSEFRSTPCTVTCGGGTQTFTREIIQAAVNGGAPCPTDLSRKERCNPDPCPIDCKVSPWNSGVCSVTCGEGVIFSYRTIDVAAANGGKPCPANLTKTDPCVQASCDVDCVMGPWVSGPCSTTCGTGKLVQTRQVVTPPQGNGAPCGDTQRTNFCKLRPCPQPEDCEVTDWVVTKECSQPCGDGVVVLTRSIIKPAVGGGKACPPDLETVQPCNLRPCIPQDCVLTDWMPGPCSVPCGDGIMLMTRKILALAKYGGKACPSQEELAKKAPCNVRPCENPEIVELERKLAVLEEQNKALREKAKDILTKNPGLALDLPIPPTLPPSDDITKFIVHLPQDV